MFHFELWTLIQTEKSHRARWYVKHILYFFNCTKIERPHSSTSLFYKQSSLLYVVCNVMPWIVKLNLINIVFQFDRLLWQWFWRAMLGTRRGWWLRRVGKYYWDDFISGLQPYNHDSSVTPHLMIWHCILCQDPDKIGQLDPRQLFLRAESSPINKKLKLVDRRLGDAPPLIRNVKVNSITAQLRTSTAVGRSDQRVDCWRPPELFQKCKDLQT